MKNSSYGTKEMEVITHDVLIFGTGLAGLRAAVEIARKSQNTINMGLVSKVQIQRPHSVCAEGGSAAVLREDEGDSLDLHAWDTVKGSDFLADQDVVYRFVERIPAVYLLHQVRCCMAACPTLATDRKYLGPMPLTQAYRYNVDSRDDGGKDRNDIVATSHGVFNCHYAGECSNVCPKGVDPARAIQLMKKDLVCDYLKLNKKKVCAPVNCASVEPKPKVAVPSFTVEK